MRQRVNGGFLCAKDKLSANCQETTSPSNSAPAAFSMNQNCALCLPLISKTQKIIWVHSDQINIQLDKVTELDKAFSRFPYITQRQTASLAQRCSLHPDQVRVWFMAQRLCYGISWDSKDIHRVRRKMLGQSGSQEKLHKSVCEQEIVKKTKRSRVVKDNGESGAASKKGAYKRKQPNDREKGTHVDAIDDNLNPKKKQKRSSKLTEEKRTTSSFDANVEGEAKGSEIVWTKTETVIRKRTPSGANSERLLGSGSKQDSTSLQKSYNEQSFANSPSVIFQPLATALEMPLLTEKLEEVRKTTDPLTHSLLNVTQETQTSSPPVTTDHSSIKKSKRVRNSYRFNSRINWRMKTLSQLEKMKVTFANYQYLNAEQYQQLSLLTGVPRYSLVQWFTDMRYFIKKKKPRWMSAEQHSRAVANVVRMQHLRTLEKTQTRERGARATRLRRKTVTDYAGTAQ